MDDSDCIRSPNVSQRLLHRMNESRAISLGVLVKRFPDQVCKDLCVGLGAKNMSPTDEFFTKVLVVFNDSVVN